MFGFGRLEATDSRGAGKRSSHRSGPQLWAQVAREARATRTCIIAAAAATATAARTRDEARRVDTRRVDMRRGGRRVLANMLVTSSRSLFCRIPRLCLRLCLCLCLCRARAAPPEGNCQTCQCFDCCRPINPDCDAQSGVGWSAVRRVHWSANARCTMAMQWHSSMLPALEPTGAITL